MKKLFFTHILGILLILFSINAVSAGLCKYSDGYYHDCRYYSGTYQTQYDYGVHNQGVYGRGFDNGYNVGYRSGYDYGYYSSSRGYTQGYRYSFEKRQYQTSQEYYRLKWSSY